MMHKEVRLRIVDEEELDALTPELQEKVRPKAKAKVKTKTQEELIPHQQQKKTSEPQKVDKTEIEDDEEPNHEKSDACPSHSWPKNSSQKPRDEQADGKKPIPGINKADAGAGETPEEKKIRETRALMQAIQDEVTVCEDCGLEVELEYVRDESCNKLVKSWLRTRDGTYLHQRCWAEHPCTLKSENWEGAIAQCELDSLCEPGEDNPDLY